MNIKYRVELSRSERDQLEALLSGGRHAARKLKRAQILLAANDGVGDEVIAATLKISGSTIYRTKRRLVEANLEGALSEELRPGAERKLSSKEEALLVATACSAPPPGRVCLGDIFASLDAEAFRSCFVAWVGALTKAPLEVIAIDGKTSRRSGRKGGKDAIHTVSAFAARQRLVLAQTKVNEKSNEIVAIPALLDMLSIEGAIVTIDAMGCQRNIAQKIVDKKADYVLALKGNQGTLRDDVELFANEQKANGFRRYDDQRRSNRRWRSWPHRNATRHRRP